MSELLSGYPGGYKHLRRRTQAVDGPPPFKVPADPLHRRSRIPTTRNIGIRPVERARDVHDWYIAEMDRMSSSIGRSLQAYLDTLDFSPYLKEVEIPTLLLVGEESPTSTLDQHGGSWPSSCRIVGWRSVPAWATASTPSTGVVHPTGTGVSRFADHLRRELCPTTCMLP